MKKLVFLSAITLSLGCFTTSCEKEEITSNDDVTQNLVDKSISQNNQEKAMGYFDLVLPSELSTLDIVTDEDFDVATEEMGFSMLNGDNVSIEGSLRVALDLKIGRIVSIEVSESFLEAGLLNSESLKLALNDPVGGFDLDDDIIQPATALGACIRSCQSDYTNNVANCAGEGSESCIKDAKRMKNVCIGGCIGGFALEIVKIFKN